jgi:hypothetical protein
MGAAAVYWLDAGDPTGWRLLLRWTKWRTGLLARAAVRRDGHRVIEEALMLGGTARGVVHGVARVRPLSRLRRPAGG